MFAYCGNNSPLFKDPNGMRYVIADGGAGLRSNFNHPISGNRPAPAPGPNKTKNIFDHIGEFFENVGDSIGAAIYSVSLSGGVGVGIGGKVSGEVFSISGVAKKDLFSFQANPRAKDPFRVGKTESISAGIGLKAMPGATIGGETTYFTPDGGEREIVDSMNAGYSFSIGGYLGFGGSLDFYWDAIYIEQRLDEIWGD